MRTSEAESGKAAIPGWDIDVLLPPEKHRAIAATYREASKDKREPPEERVLHGQNVRPAREAGCL